MFSGVVLKCRTYNSSSLGSLNERQRAVVGFFGHVDGAVLQLVLLENAVQLKQQVDPLGALMIAISQNQDGRLVAQGAEMRRRYL